MTNTRFWEGTKMPYDERKANEDRAKAAWRARNPERVRAYGRKNAAIQRERHPDRIKARREKDYAKNRERYIEKSKTWRLANRERYNALMRAAYQRRKAQRQALRCLQCESILKDTNTIYCTWCITTYNLCQPMTQQSND